VLAFRRARVNRHQQGFALLIVLWTMVLLALLAGTIGAAGRSEARLASNLLASAQAEAAADGAVAAALYHALDASQAHWAADGTTHVLTLEVARVQVAVQDQDGLVDPNQAPPGLLAALLRQTGATDTTAQQAANAIVDWRSATDDGLAGVYAAQNRAFGPPHEPFESVDELALVAYITPAIMLALRPHINPFLQATPDPALADPVVTAAIADATRRSQLTLGSVASNGPSILAVTATAHAANATFTRRALLRFDARAE
jgi:general secretion pathway protein K